jgi:hypothetical protein
MERIWPSQEAEENLDELRHLNGFASILEFRPEMTEHCPANVGSILDVK